SCPAWSGPWHSSNDPCSDDIATLDREETAPLLNTTARHALVIGGSMSGLFAGTLLRKAGLAVDTYERADVELTARAAGSVAPPQMRAVRRAAGCAPSRDLGVEVTSRRTLDRAGGVIGEHACPQTLTSWDRVFRMLRKKFPA